MKVILTLTLALLGSMLALAQNHDEAERYLYKGIEKYKLEDYEYALEYFNKAVELDPNNAENYYIRGLARFRLEDYLGSRDDIIETLKIDSNHYDALIALDALNQIIKELYKY